MKKDIIFISSITLVLILFVIFIVIIKNTPSVEVIPYVVKEPDTSMTSIPATSIPMTSIPMTSIPETPIPASCPLSPGIIVLIVILVILFLLMCCLCLYIFYKKKSVIDTLNKDNDDVIDYYYNKNDKLQQQLRYYQKLYNKCQIDLLENKTRSNSIIKKEYPKMLTDDYIPKIPIRIITDGGG